MERLPRSLIDFIWPQACPGCGVAGSDRLCELCLMGCPRDLGDAQGIPDAIDGLSSAFLYLGRPAELIRRWKYGLDSHAGSALCSLLVDSLPGCDALGWPDCVVAIPADPRRVRRRGFDQAQLLAAAVSLRLGLPRRVLLRRHSGRSPQAGLDRGDRLKNLSGVFYASGAFSRAILLVDDVLTTGATVAEAAATLRLAGARRVWTTTLCRSPSPAQK